MKQLFTLIFITLFFGVSFSQAPPTLWAKSIGGSETEYVHGISTDASGNIYMIATFNSTVLNVGNITFTNTGGEDILITKHAPNGTLIWAKQIGSVGDDYGCGITIDVNNDIYIAGSFNSPTLTFGTSTFTNAGGQDIYLAKLTSAGNHVWAVSTGSAAIERPTGIATDSNGNVYFAGYFGSTCVFGTTSLTPVSNYDAFLAKYSPTGSCLWAKAATGSIYTGFNSVCTDPNGNVIVAGEFESSTVNFGGTTLNNASAYRDAFVAKYDPTGSIIWAQPIQGPEDDFVLSVTADANSNVIVGGRFFSSTLTVGSNNLVRAGQENAYLLKFNSNGNALWANSIMGSTNELGTSVSCDASGNIFLGGIMSSSTLVIGSNSYTNEGVYDSFLINYSPSGAIQWSEKIGGTGMDYIQAITTDNNNNLIVAGYSTSNPLALGTNSLVNANDSTFNIFFFKVSAPTSVTEIRGDQFNVSPNPFSDNCTVSFDTFQENSTLEIFDVTGRKVKQIQFSGNKSTISKDNLGSGVYYLRVKNSGKNLYNGKIVIQ